MFQYKYALLCRQCCTLYKITKFTVIVLPYNNDMATILDGKHILNPIPIKVIRTLKQGTTCIDISFERNLAIRHDIYMIRLALHDFQQFIYTVLY